MNTCVPSLWKGFCPQWISRNKPILPVSRTGERIAGISCPRRGHQVPRGLGQFQTGRLRRPSGPHNQPVAVKSDSPERAARYLLQQQDDTCWHFPDTFLTLFTYLRKRYQSVCQSVLSAKRRLADTLTLFFEKTFFPCSNLLPVSLLFRFTYAKIMNFIGKSKLLMHYCRREAPSPSFLRRVSTFSLFRLWCFSDHPLNPS